MSQVFKTVFKHIRGRVVPVRVSMMGAPDEWQKVNHAVRARQYMAKEATQVGDAYGKMFVKKSLKDSKIVGEKIGMRIAKLAKLARRLPK
jgi:hypothetical protein